MIQKLKQQLINLLIFTRFIDENGQLSITNIAVMIVLWKLAMVQSTSITDCGALFLSLSHYSYKKFLNKQTINQAASIANQIAAKADELSSSEKDS